MGSIKKTKAGNFQSSAYDAHGVRHRRTFSKKSEAQAFISKVEAIKHDKKLVGAKLKRARISFEQALTEYSLSKSDLRPKTIAKYKFILNQFQLFLEHNALKYVDQFTADHGSLLFQLLMEGSVDFEGKVTRANPKTINHFLQVIRSFFALEVEKGHLDRSPMLHVKNLKEEKPRPEYYSEQELEDFFAQQMPEAYRNAFMALLNTGMRVNELASLEWDDIDITRRLIYVRSRDGFTTKTDNSERAIPINGSLFTVINQLRQNPKSKIYPFCSITGSKLSDRRLLEACKVVGKAAGIKRRVFLHKFRHTFATHLVKRRVPIEAIQKLLGHSSINETMIYTHVRTEELHSDVELLNDLGKSREVDDENSNPDYQSNVFNIAA